MDADRLRNASSLQRRIITAKKVLPDRSKTV